MILDPVALLADKSRLDVLIDRRGDGQRALAMRGTADPVEPRLAREHLDDDEVLAFGLGEDRLYVGDLQGRPAAAGGLLGPDSHFRQGQRGRGQARDSQDTPPRRFGSFHVLFAPRCVSPRAHPQTA